MQPANGGAPGAGGGGSPFEAALRPLLSRLAAHKQSDTAWRLYDELLARGASLDAAAYVGFIRAVGSAKSAGLARRALTELDAGASDEQRVVRLFRIALSRRPSDLECRHLLTALSAERRRLTGDPDAASALVANAASIGALGELDAVELGAWFCVSSVLLNLDEGVTKG